MQAEYLRVQTFARVALHWRPWTAGFSHAERERKWGDHAVWEVLTPFKTAEDSPCRPLSLWVFFRLRAASEASVETGGGSLDGSITAYDVNVRTCGGSVSLKRLVGRQAEVTSGGGPVDIKVVYGDSVSVVSGETFPGIQAAKPSTSAPSSLFCLHPDLRTSA